MASSSTLQDLRAEFLASAQALFAKTKDGAEIYHLIHEVVHQPSVPTVTSKPLLSSTQTTPAKPPTAEPKKRASVTTTPLLHDSQAQLTIQTQPATQSQPTSSKKT